MRLMKVGYRVNLIVFISFLIVKPLLAQWSILSQPYDGSISTLTIVNNNLIAGALGYRGDGGLFLSTDNGKTWQNKLWNRVYSGNVVGIRVFVGTANGLYISNDHGLSWNLNSSFQDIFAVASNNKKIFLGNSGVIVSTNDGLTWNIETSLKGYSIHSIVVSGSDIFAASPFNTDNDSYVFRSTDNGSHWRLTKNGLPKTFIMSLAVYKSHLFAATSNSGVYRSTDQGKNWVPCNNGLTSLQANKLFFVGTNLLASTWSGFFISTNYGDSWKSINEGLENKVVNSFAMDETFVYVGTNSGGVYKRKISEMIEDLESVFPTNFKLEQNYPNPFNTSTLITYSIPQPSNVTITVYDILGNKISTLVNEYKTAGNYDVEFDAITLTSGVYLYQLQANGFVQMKKLILIK